MCSGQSAGAHTGRAADSRRARIISLRIVASMNRVPNIERLEEHAKVDNRQQMKQRRVWPQRHDVEIGENGSVAWSNNPATGVVGSTTAMPHLEEL